MPLAFLRRMERPTEPALCRRLAGAVLLLELARADFAQQPAELDALRRELMRAYGLSDAEVEALLDRARDHSRHSVSLHAHLDTLNRELDAAGKRELLAMLWRVAYADGRLDPQEEALIRRLADLLFIPHAVFIQEKLGAAA